MGMRQVFDPDESGVNRVRYGHRLATGEAEYLNAECEFRRGRANGKSDARHAGDDFRTHIGQIGSIMHVFNDRAGESGITKHARLSYCNTFNFFELKFGARAAWQSSYVHHANQCAWLSECLPHDVA